MPADWAEIGLATALDPQEQRRVEGIALRAVTPFSHAHPPPFFLRGLFHFQEKSREKREWSRPEKRGTSSTGARTEEAYRVPPMPHTLRKIPLRMMNRPPSVASVINTSATWRCACANPIALHGRSGRSSGPTPDTVVICDQCRRVYFVIPQDKSHGPPIEVVELFEMPTAPSIPTEARV